MKKITARHYAALLENWSSQSAFEALKPRLTAMAKWMVGHGQSVMGRGIGQAWDALDLRKGSLALVELTTPAPLNEKDRQSLLQLLERNLGKKILLKEKVHPDLIGGATLRIGDRQWDGSIQEQLHQLHLTLLR